MSAGGAGQNASPGKGTPRSVTVPLSERSYEVHIGHGSLAGVGPWTREAARGARAFLVVDANLPATIVQRAAGSLMAAGFAITTAQARATETDKSLETVERLLAEVAETNHERRDPVIALGGGIVGDVAGFVAAIYRRGVPVIQCPTTLLSMVDASVGGKTGVNLAGGGAARGGLKKNFVGAFHQPALVVADVATLDSLPDRELRCGLAECVKHGLIAAAEDGGALLAWIEANLSRIAARDPASLVELVERNVRLKAGIVGRDEREDSDKDVRAALNLGHTFGHAIETLPGLTPDGDPAHAPLHHGEAVALGLVAAARCAEHLGLCERALGDRVVSVLRRIGLPVQVSGLPDSGAVLAAMRHDKKVQGGRLRLVLPTGAGVRVVDDPDEAAIRTGLAAIRT